MNVNEILYNGLYDLVADVTCGGMVLNDGYVVEGTYENGKMIGFEDLLEIVESNNTNRFYNLEIRYEEGTQTIKSLCRHWTKNQLSAYGVKFNNGTMARMFKVVKEIVNDMTVLSDKNEQDLQMIKNDYNIICKDVLQYALYVERSMVSVLEEN